MKVIKDTVGSYSAVSPADFSTWLKVSYTGTAPTDLTDALYAAAAYVEKIAWFRLSTRLVTFIAKDWGDYEFDLEMTGTLSSPTCAYFDSDNVSQSLTITSSWLEKTGENNSVFHLAAASYPSVYDRADAIAVSFTLTPYDTTLPHELKTAIYMLASYFYDCRTNDKEPVLTTVDKIVAGVRRKEF